MAALLSAPPHDLAAIGRLFELQGRFESGHPFGAGHINDTYAVTYRESGGAQRYLLQRINTDIFRDPAALMENIERVVLRLRRKLIAEPEADPDREALALLPGRDCSAFARDAVGHVWRAYRMIEGARSLVTADTPNQAYEAARAFGLFQRRLADLPGPRLRETIPDFHHTPRRLADFQTACRLDRRGRVAAAREEIASAERYAPLAGLLLDAQARGLMPERITHNDAKIDNVLMDTQTGRGLCVIDLDTVMPGLSLYDFGDLVRSAVSPAAEDETDLSTVAVRLPFYAALVRGYLEGAGATLTPTERRLLPEAGLLITYEVGLRFLTDYLSGDTYFKIHRPDHNLERARNQFALVARLEERLDDMRAAGEQVTPIP